MQCGEDEILEQKKDINGKTSEVRIIVVIYHYQFLSFDKHSMVV